MDLFLIIFFYFILIFSILGYGKFFCLFCKEKFNLGFIGLIGILFLIILSYLTNFITTHGYIHNLTIIVLGLIFFIYFIFKNYFVIKDLKIIIFIFSILFIGLLMYKNHDDFITYHFPYSLTLINYKKIIGLGNITSGFTTPSSIFYLNSLFYLPGIKFYLMNSGAILIMGFSNLVLIDMLENNLKYNKKFILFLTAFSFVFINTVFYRIAEHGTDRSALILVFILSIVFLDSINYKKNFIKENLYNSYFKIIILITLIISLKSFYLIYTILIFLWVYYFRKNLFKRLIIKNLFNNRFFYLCFTGISLFLLTVFLNTGCLIFPASFTCFDNYSWSMDLNQVKDFKNWFEQWAKAGAAPNFRVENPENYIQGLNWFYGWLERYFFTKVTDFFLVVFIIISIFMFLFIYKKKKKIYSGKIKFKLFYLFILLFCLEWFYNHPALRYGGYSILALVFFIPVSIYLSSFNNKVVDLGKKLKILVLLTFIIFVSKNINRIYDEKLKYGYQVFNEPYFYLDKSAFRTDIQIKKILEQNKNLSYKGYLIIKKN